MTGVFQAEFQSENRKYQGPVAWPSVLAHVSLHCHWGPRSIPHYINTQLKITQSATKVLFDKVIKDFRQVLIVYKTLTGCHETQPLFMTNVDCQ